MSDTVYGVSYSGRGWVLYAAYRMHTHWAYLVSHRGSIRVIARAGLGLRLGQWLRLRLGLGLGLWLGLGHCDWS